MRLRSVILCAFLAAGWAGASSITYTFAGDATGTAGLTSFTDEPFTFTFITNTSDVATPLCCTEDLSTESATPATVMIGSIGTGTLLDTQAIFVNPTEETIGIWHYNEPDWLDIVSSVATTYNLASSVGPVTPSAAFGNVQMEGHSMSSSLGNLAFDSVSNVTFTASVANPQTTPDPTPEPSTLGLMGMGFAALFWRVRKRV